MTRYVIPWDAKIEVPAEEGQSLVDYAVSYLMEQEGLTAAEAKAELRRRREAIIGTKKKRAN